jgi:pilus assembly protein CpaF
MFAIVLTEKGGEQRRLVFNKPEITIGRVQGNDIVLPKGNVSKRHARVLLKDGKFIIVDLKSTNGTYVNGRKITTPLVVKEADKIYIGDFIMGVEETNGEAGESAGEPAAPTPPPPAPPPREPPGGGASNELLRAALQRQDPPARAPERPAGPLGGPGGPLGGPGGPLGGPGGPLGGPGGPLGGPLERPAPAREPGPLAAPPGEPRTRPPRPAPGGTLPPPVGGPVGAPPPAQTLAPPPMVAPPASGPPPMMVAPPSSGPPPMGPGPAMAPPPMAPAPMAPAPAVMAPPAAATPVGASPMMAPPPAAPAPPTEQRPAVPMPAPAPQASRPRLVGAGARKVASRSVAPPSRRGVVLEPLDPKVIKALDLQAQILERLRAKVDLDNIPIERLGDEDVWQKSERAIVDLVNGLEQSGELPKYVDRDGLIKDTLNEALGLGPLEDLLADDKLDEIRVDRRDRVIVGKDEAMRGSGRAFSSDDVLRRVVERLVAPLGLTVDDDHPVVDVRLRDGSRLTAAVAPASVHGPCLVLRKPVRIKRTLADLVGAGGLSPAMSSFLSTCVAARRNLAVCGPAGAGKAGIVAALVGAVPDGERVVTVEDVAELSLDREDWIALETRPTVGLGALVASALRLRPDRLVVGDLRGGEAFDVASAFGAAVDGAIVALTGDGAQAALARWVSLAQLGAPTATEPVVRELIAGACDVVVHVARGADGAIRIVAIDEVLGVREVGFDTVTLFAHRGDEGYAATGAIPRFWTDLEARGVAADPTIFRPSGA